MLAFWIILLLIVVSGFVSYFGDKVGHYVGRRRLSVFGMRPRFTAILVSIVSGILIASITFGTFIVLSREARLALFGLEDLRGKIISLEKVRNKLEKEIEVRQKGSLLFRNGEVFLTTLIPGGLDQVSADQKIKQVLDLLGLYLSNLGIKDGESLISLSNKNYKRAVNLLSSRSEDQVLQVKVIRNVIYGEKIAIELIFSPNRLVYLEGEEIIGSEINSSLSDPEIERELQLLLAEARALAERKGIIPDATGSLGSIPYAEIFNTVKAIRPVSPRARRGGQKGKNVKVKVVANRPIYSIGPLSVSFDL